MFVLYILGGVLGGILGGMGMGGGTVLIPVLTVFFGIPQKTAQAINLISFIPMACISLIIHAKNKLIKVKNIFLVIASGLISSAIASGVALKIEDDLLRKFFGGFLIVLSVVEVVLLIKKKVSENQTEKDKKKGGNDNL